jgi:5'/3'-nucleotidase
LNRCAASPIAAAIGCALVGASIAGPTARAAELCGHGPLEILLTNDDGYQSPGIRALYDALKAAGHSVTLVAPESDSSGSSSSLTRSEVVVHADTADTRIRAVTATPATTVLLAVNAPLVAARPDLVVLGINDGANTGAALPFSGTVGAVIAGAVLLDPPVHGVAVSAARATQPAQGNDGRSADSRLMNIARRFVQLLDALRPAFCAHDVVANGAAHST